MLIGTHVQLEEMLKVRDNRAAKQAELIAKYHLPLICFTMNIPGPVKNNALTEFAFYEGCTMLKNGLKIYGISCVFQELITQHTGCEGYFVVDCNASKVKKLTAYIEDNEDLCRLFDMDVLDIDGMKVERERVGMQPRRCFLCNDYSKNCARSRKHSLEELTAWVAHTIVNYKHHSFADHIATLATRSLLYEVCISPKPGLVDRLNSGSHKDMDVFTFMDSAASLTPYFRNCVLKGITHAELDAQAMLDIIRFEGIKAEYHMLASTKGVNTHKGAIFSLGIICCATGMLFAREKELSVASILSLCAEIAGDVVAKDFAHLTAENAVTFGQKLFIQTGNAGVRGEVASGMPAVKEIGLPIFRKCMELGKTVNESGAITLYHLIANVLDTNIISRSSLETQQQVQQRALDYLTSNPYPSYEYLQKIDAQFIQMNISPGGCADLLAITILLYFMENDIFPLTNKKQ